MSLELKLAHFRNGTNFFRRRCITFYEFHKILPTKWQKKAKICQKYENLEKIPFLSQKYRRQVYDLIPSRPAIIILLSKMGFLKSPS